VPDRVKGLFLYFGLNFGSDEFSVFFFAFDLYIGPYLEFPMFLLKFGIVGGCYGATTDHPFSDEPAFGHLFHVPVEILFGQGNIKGQN